MPLVSSLKKNKTVLMLSESGLFEVRNPKLCIKNADTPKNVGFHAGPFIDI